MKKRYSLPQNKNSSFTLNITSMTDMFTILLVFLLQTYSANEVEIKTNQQVRLPSSNSELNPTNAPQLIVSTDEILFKDKSIAKLVNHKISDKDLSKDDEQFIDALFAALQDESSKIADKQNGQLLLQADKEIAYSELRKILYTASMAGFPNIKIVTQLGR